jgi:hypothetical protein
MDLAVGDTVRLKSRVSDANGRYLERTPEVTWSSTNPDGISVDSGGKVTALKEGATAEIRAIGQDGVGQLSVSVSIPASGPPAILRVANAADGAGPITFVPTKGTAKTLKPGETATLEIPPGLVLIQAQSTPNQFHTFPSVSGVSIKSGEKVTFYAVGEPDYLRLREVWTTPLTVSPDKAVVDVLQGVPAYPVIYIERPGTALVGKAPANCYFDWTDLAAWEGSPGAIDLLLLNKYPNLDVQSSLRVDAKGGMRTTVILSGSPARGMTYFAFPDP